jgi:hypothetical protein
MNRCEGYSRTWGKSRLLPRLPSVHSFMVDKSAPHLIIGVADGTADLRRAGG